jgi:hypothetical protein
VLAGFLRHRLAFGEQQRALLAPPRRDLGVHHGVIPGCREARRSPAAWPVAPVGRPGPPG